MSEELYDVDVVLEVLREHKEVGWDFAWGDPGREFHSWCTDRGVPGALIDYFRAFCIVEGYVFTSFAMGTSEEIRRVGEERPHFAAVQLLEIGKSSVGDFVLLDFGHEHMGTVWLASHERPWRAGRELRESLRRMGASIDAALSEPERLGLRRVGGATRMPGRQLAATGSDISSVRNTCVTASVPLR